MTEDRKDTQAYWLSRVKSRSASVRALALSALGFAAREASRVMPAFLAGLEDADESVRASAARALDELAPHIPEAVPSLVKRLSDDSPRVRRNVIACLWHIRPFPEYAVAELLRMRRDADPYIASVARDIRIASEGEAPAAVARSPETPVTADEASLIAALGQGSARDRLKAVRALDDSRLEASAVVEALTRALGDRSSEVRKGAAYALRDRGERAAAVAVEPLLRSLGDRCFEVRVAAMRALASIGRGAVSKVLRECPAPDATFAAAALGWLGIERSWPTPELRSTAVAGWMLRGPDGVDGLRRLAGDPDPWVRRLCIVAMGCVGRAAATALAQRLDDRVARIRREATITLMHMGTPAPEAAPALARMALRARTEATFGAAAAALSSVDPTGEASAQLVEPALQRRFADRMIAVWLLWFLPRPGPAARDLLILARDDRSPNIRAIAAGALCRADPTDLKSLDVLLGMMANRCAEAAWRAVLALGRIRPVPAAAVAPLILALKHRDGGVRAAAAESLGLAATVAREAVEPLQSLARDDLFIVRRAAHHAIRRIRGTR